MANKASSVPKDIRRETAAAKTNYDAEVSKLFDLLARADETTRKRIIDGLDEKTIAALRTVKNPYQTPVYQGKDTVKNKILLFNVINLREKYLRRFCMTSMIGFTYRMLMEYMPKAAENLPSQNDAKFANVLNAKLKLLKRNRPEEICRSRIKELKTVIDAASADADPREMKLKYYELLVEQIKLIKYMMYFTNKDKEELKNKSDRDNRDLSQAKIIREGVIKRLAVTSRMLELRKEFDKSPEAKSYNDELAKKPSLRDQPMPDYSTYEVKTCKLSDYEKYHSIENFVEQVELRKKERVLVDEDVAVIEKKVAANEEAMSILVAKIKDLNKKLEKVIGDFAKHFPGQDTDIDVSEYDPTDEEYDAAVDAAKKDLGIEKTKEEFADDRREEIQEFLDEYFVYDPDLHVQCAYKPNYDDSLRTPLITSFIDLQNGKISEATHAANVADHAKKVEKVRVIAEESIERSLIPPDDTFFRLDRYIENNYEELRQATDDIYAEKSDLEFSIVPLAVFDGPDAGEVQTQAEMWQRKYADEVEGDVYQAKFGQHNLLGSWQQTREKREFYTKNTEIIRRIIQQSEDDAKMGKRLMKERAEKAKAKDVKDLGPDPKSFGDYKKKHLAGGGLETGGAKHISEIDAKSAITRDDLLRLNDAGESTKDEVELEFKNIRPQKRGKRRVGRTDAGKFHISTDAKNPAKGYMMTAEDHQKHLSMIEMKKSAKESTDI